MGEEHGWWSIHATGLILTITGLGLTGVSWYLAIQTKGLLLNAEIAVRGPFVLINGLSHLIFPREWARLGAKGIHISWRAEVGTLMLGLILGLANLYTIKALIG